MRRFHAAVVKTGAFARKEIADVLRQPRLVVTLILGPFLILALFGIGYQRERPPIRAVLVIEEDNAGLRESLEEKLDQLGGSIVVEATLSDPNEGLEWVRSDRADVAIIAPLRPYETVREGRQAEFEILHDTIDPFEQATIDLVARTTIQGVNRDLLAEVIAAGQDESAEVMPLVGASRESAALLRRALEENDQLDARAQRLRLADTLEEVSAIVQPTEVLRRTLGSGLGNAETEQLSATALDLLDRTESLQLDVDEPVSGQLDEVRALEDDLAELEEVLADFRRIEADVLVSPLDAEADLVGAVDVDPNDFYAPGVIVLLLQHLAITFASLSFVRERALGTTEVFQVAPLGAGHVIAGKYLGYTVGASVVAAALSALILGAFDVPILGSYADYAAVVFLLIVSSLGVGFLIAGFAGSDTEAVNMSMIVLLLSIFFSGFFLSLDRLLPEVRTVSWLLPITHALDSLRDVMFRGTGIDLRTWVALGGGSIALYLAGWFILYRRMRPA